MPTAQSATSVALTVRDYGAVGDGETDDTAAFQRALDTASGMIRVPAGRYRIDGTLRIMRSGIELSGEGAEQTVLFAGGGRRDADMLVIARPKSSGRINNVRVAALTFTADARAFDAVQSDTAWRRHGIVVDFSNNVRLDDVHVDHFEQSGVYLDNAIDQGGPDETFFFRVRVTACGDGFDLRRGHSTKVLGGYTGFNRRHGVIVADRNSVYLSSMDIEKNGQAGLRIAGKCANVSVTDCTFESNGRGWAAKDEHRVHVIIGIDGLASQVRFTGCFFLGRGQSHLMTVHQANGLTLQDTYVLYTREFDRPDRPLIYAPDPSAVRQFMFTTLVTDVAPSSPVTNIRQTDTDRAQ